MRTADIQQMAADDHVLRTANLEDLRSQLTARLALLLTGISGLAIWLTLPQKTFPITSFTLLGAVLALGMSVRSLVAARPTLARHLLIWGLTVALLAAMWLFSAPWIPSLSLLVIFIGAMLVAGSELATAGVVIFLGIVLVRSGERGYWMPGLYVTLILGLALAWLTVHTLYTALQWARTMQQRSDHLLDQMRDRQAKLNRTLKSLELANDLQRRTQRELILARNQAEEARRMKEQFAANISHELRTPLNLILGFSEVMYLSPEVYGEVSWPPNLRRDVYQIYRSSRHLLEMIDDILDLSRFDIAGFTLNQEHTPLEPFLKDTVEIAQDLFRDHPVHLEVAIEHGLPALEVDRTRIRQVLLNLLANARRFTQEGTVRLETKQIEGEIVICVTDTGPGIPSDRIPYIFDEFYQGDYSLRRDHGGTGLGLAISRHFVQAHEGRIWVESQEGVGSKFTFTLPIPGQLPPLLQFHTEASRERAQPETISPILVVDPDPAVVSLIRRHMKEYEVIQVEDVNHLAEAVNLHHPLAVVRNVSPREKHTYEDIGPEAVPIIECSLPSRLWTAHALSVTACLAKPITAQQLFKEMERLGDIRDVLIVDDDRGFVQLVERMLQVNGRPFDIRRAYDGEDGLQAIRKRRPDLLLLDLVMPGTDGFQVLEEIRQDPALVELPVVLLTATSYAEDALKQHDSQIVIHRSGGLYPNEILHYVRAAVSTLEPRYAEQSISQDIASAGTNGASFGIKE